MGCGAFAYYCSVCCVIMKVLWFVVIVMEKVVAKVKRTEKVTMSKIRLGFRLYRERGSRLGKERIKKKIL